MDHNASCSTAPPPAYSEAVQGNEGKAQYNMATPAPSCPPHHIPTPPPAPVPHVYPAIRTSSQLSRMTTTSSNNDPFFQNSGTLSHQSTMGARDPNLTESIVLAPIVPDEYHSKCGDGKAFADNVAELKNCAVVPTSTNYGKHDHWKEGAMGSMEFACLCLPRVTGQLASSSLEETLEETKKSLVKVRKITDELYRKGIKEIQADYDNQERALLQSLNPGKKIHTNVFARTITSFLDSKDKYVQPSPEQLKSVHESCMQRYTVLLGNVYRHLQSEEASAYDTLHKEELKRLAEFHTDELNKQRLEQQKQVMEVDMEYIKNRVKKFFMDSKTSPKDAKKARLAELEAKFQKDDVALAKKQARRKHLLESLFASKDTQAAAFYNSYAQAGAKSNTSPMALSPVASGHVKSPIMPQSSVSSGAMAPNTLQRAMTGPDSYGSLRSEFERIRAEGQPSNQLHHAPTQPVYGYGYPAAQPQPPYGAYSGGMPPYGQYMPPQQPGFMPNQQGYMPPQQGFMPQQGGYVAPPAYGLHEGKPATDAPQSIPFAQPAFPAPSSPQPTMPSPIYENVPRASLPLPAEPTTNNATQAPVTPVPDVAANAEPSYISATDPAEAKNPKEADEEPLYETIPDLYPNLASMPAPTTETPVPAPRPAASTNGSDEGVKSPVAPPRPAPFVRKPAAESDGQS